MFVILAPFEERVAHEPHRRRRSLAELREQFRARSRRRQVVAFGAPPVDGLGNTGGFKLQVQDRGRRRAPRRLQGAVANVDRSRATRSPASSACSAASAPTSRSSTSTSTAPRPRRSASRSSDVFDTLQIYLGSAYVNDFTRFGRNWQVNVQADAAFRLQPEDIGKLKVRNARRRHGAARARW